jgi:predicted transcriptional regulator
VSENALGDCGVDYEGFADYFAGLQTAYAIEVRQPRRIEPVALGFRGPMSFRPQRPAHVRLLTAADV